MASPSRQSCRSMTASVWAVAAAMLVALACADELEPAAAGGPEPAEGGRGEDTGETQDLLKELTINMGSEVLDERTVLIRDTTKAGKKYVRLRLGNVAPIEQGSLSEEQYNEKVEKAKLALGKLVEKQMFFWKAAPEDAQPKEQPDTDSETVVADIWTLDGQHINGALTKAGHATKTEEYQSELARDILSVEAETKKQESYKELEKALRESERAKAKEAAQVAKEETERAQQKRRPGESFGFAGWIGLSVVLLLLVGVATNFGRPGKKQKVNLNRKRSLFQRFMAKIKGE